MSTRLTDIEDLMMRQPGISDWEIWKDDGQFGPTFDLAGTVEDALEADPDGERGDPYDVDTRRANLYEPTIVKLIELSVEEADPALLRAIMKHSQADHVLIADGTQDPDLLAELARSDDYSIRLAVASNPSCPPEILAQLAQDEDREVRQAVAAQQKCPTHVLVELLGDDASDVRLTAAQNPSLDPADLERVILSLNEEVQRVIAARDDVADHVRAAAALAL